LQGRVRFFFSKKLADDEQSAYLGAIALGEDGKIEVMWCDVAAGNGGRKLCEVSENSSSAFFSFFVCGCRRPKMLFCC
jgi:hypothetical protein